MLGQLRIAGALLCAAAAVAVARADQSYLSIYDSGFRFQVANITPDFFHSRTDYYMGSDYVFLPSGDTVSTGFGPSAPGAYETFTDWNAYFSVSQQWWFYRGTGDTREYSLSNQTAFTQVSDNTVTMEYSEPVAGVNDALRFTFTYSIEGEQGGPDTALVSIDWSVENTSAVTQDVSLFSFANPNAGGLSSYFDDVWSYTESAQANEFLIEDSPTSNFPFLTMGAYGDLGTRNTGWHGSGFNFQFIDNGTDNCSGGGSHPANGDEVDCTMQFGRTLAPGQSAGGSMYLGYNTTIPEPGTLVSALIVAGCLFRGRR